MSTGYSGAALWKKLGLKPGLSATVINAPKNYSSLLGRDVPEASWQPQIGENIEFIHVFTKIRFELSETLDSARTLMDRNGMIWVSWPKKASRVPTEITENVIRELALPLGLVDVKVCAVDNTWSGLKLVIRKELR